MRKTKVTEILKDFNTSGCLWYLFDEDMNRLDLGVVDWITLTRFDNATAFWLLVTLPGFQDSPQHAHTISGKRIIMDDSYKVVVHDHLDRVHFIEKIDPVTDQPYYQRLLSWRAFVVGATQTMKQARESAFLEHQEIAEKWNSST